MQYLTLPSLKPAAPPTALDLARISPMAKAGGAFATSTGRVPVRKNGSSTSVSTVDTIKSAKIENKLKEPLVSFNVNKLSQVYTNAA